MKQPELVFDDTPAFGTETSYHITRDGQTLVLIDRAEGGDAEGVTVIVNWLDELKRRVP